MHDKRYRVGPVWSVAADAGNPQHLPQWRIQQAPSAYFVTYPEAPKTTNMHGCTTEQMQWWHDDGEVDGCTTEQMQWWHDDGEVVVTLCKKNKLNIDYIYILGRGEGRGGLVYK